MEKCLCIWLNYMRECSTLSISAKNGKVFIFLVKLYSASVPPYWFQSYGEPFEFAGLGGWLAAYWSPTGHVAVFYVWETSHIAWHVAVYYVWELVALPDALLYIMCWELVVLPDALPFFCRLRVQVAIVCLLPSRHPWMFKYHSNSKGCTLLSNEVL